MNETLWERFMKSGSVADYLAYVQQAEVRNGAGENCGNDFKTARYR